MTVLLDESWVFVTYGSASVFSALFHSAMGDPLAAALETLVCLAFIHDRNGYRQAFAAVCEAFPRLAQSAPYAEPPRRRRDVPVPAGMSRRPVVSLRANMAGHR